MQVTDQRVILDPHENSSPGVLPRPALAART